MMTTFSAIKIKNKHVYLMVDDNGNFKWCNNKNNALSFQTEVQAQDFGKNYFKRFKDWEVQDVEINFG